MAQGGQGLGGDPFRAGGVAGPVEGFGEAAREVWGVGSVEQVDGDGWGLGD
ncbi:MAG TPA: hypothetical protein VM677_30595 [Actinokineospora sp.]|nr:hypothetical protein [Actinokineospora sp.]